MSVKIYLTVKEIRTPIQDTFMGHRMIASTVENPNMTNHIYWDGDHLNLGKKEMDKFIADLKRFPFNATELIWRL